MLKRNSSHSAAMENHSCLKTERTCPNAYRTREQANYDALDCIERLYKSVTTTQLQISPARFNPKHRSGRCDVED